MKHLFTLTLLFLSPLGMMAQEDCEHAGTIVPGTVHNVTMQTGSQIPAPCIASPNNTQEKGAWYKYTPTEMHTTTVSTEISGQDTRVHVYSGSCGSLVCIGGDDDSGFNLTSVISFTAEADVTYYIAFDDYWPEMSDDFSFTVEEGPYVEPIPEMFTMQSVDSDPGMYKNCVADMNGDYLDDIVSPQDGTSVRILYQAPNGSGFEMETLTTPSTTFMPDWSMAAGDYNKDGYNDMLYGNGSGFSIILSNEDGTAFDEKLDSPIYVFSQRSNFVDINNDGELDAFVCHDVEPNVFYTNDGAGGGVFTQGTLGDYPSGGNYGSIWIDYDNDGDMDLFIAKCRGGGDDASKDELHRNNGDGTFTNVIQADMADHHQSWSSAWGDYDNDGDLDVMVGASSNDEGSHRLYENDGAGNFTNVTEGSGLDEASVPMNIEHVTHDFNNDGFLDIFNGSGVILLGNGDMTFTIAGVTPWGGPMGDLNNDGFMDVVNGNNVYFGYDNGNNWIKIHLQGVESNRNGIGARVEVYTATEGMEKQIREIRSGDGFRYMSSLNAHFGIGETEEIEKVVVKWPSGTVDTILNPNINEALLVVEGEHVLGNEEFAASTFTLYPNPAKEFLTITGMETGETADIYDLGGKLVKSADVTNNTVPVQSLAKGTYIIMIKDAEGRQHSAKFIKG